MLTQIESFPGVFLASTNFAENFDPASLRRFDMKIGFGFLTPENAARLLATHCRALGLPQPSSADAARLASMHGLTPGDFALVARRHHFQPVEGPGGFVEALAEELEQKPENRRAVGFR
jgi:SpoVK/Ycf46/Vps4 family AAA+-type ATPase